ncbi:MAG: hypothetical protein LBK41_00915 [Clostridiales bacterium]|nr:hypothetical protein [Clostridiales bacterium]
MPVGIGDVRIPPGAAHDFCVIQAKIGARRGHTHVTGYIVVDRFLELRGQLALQRRRHRIGVVLGGLERGGFGAGGFLGNFVS